MSERDTSTEVRTDLNKTYAYFNAVLSSLYSANALLFALLAVYSLSHNGIDTETDLPAGPNIAIIALLSGISLVFLLLFAFFARSWYKRIKALESKAVTAVISLIIYAVLIPILSYASFLAVGALTMF